MGVRLHNWIKDGIQLLMASYDKQPAEAGTANKKQPDWARGLRDLYDDVVEEPLPPSFKDLLDKLDAPKK